MNTFKCCGAGDPPCKTFEGSCQNPSNYPACERCGGSGDIFVDDTTRGPDGGPLDVPCPKCGGTGAA